MKDNLYCSNQIYVGQIKDTTSPCSPGLTQTMSRRQRKGAGWKPGFVWFYIDVTKNHD